MLSKSGQFAVGDACKPFAVGKADGSWDHRDLRPLYHSFTRKSNDYFVIFQRKRDPAPPAGRPDKNIRDFLPKTRFLVEKTTNSLYNEDVNKLKRRTNPMKKLLSLLLVLVLLLGLVPGAVFAEDEGTYVDFEEV